MSKAPVPRTLVLTPSIALIAACLTFVSAGFALTPYATAATAERAAAPVTVTITINRFDPGPPVPARFLGLSFELAALGQLGGDADRGDLVTLLRSLGPGILRFGGITADENVAWTDTDTPRPAWASSTIGPAQMRALGVLARRSGWQVLLTVGLAHDEPQAAAREVAAAHSALGPYLAAVEIGNEPDAYGKHGFRELPWIAQGYEEQVSSYREAIAALTPGVPIAGPDVSGSGVFPEWGEEEALSQRPTLLTGHHYPLGCTPSPSIETLLSPAIRGREANSLATYITVAHTYRLPLRIDETNSVSCGGVPGVSDTFASALWASAYITQAMSAGAAGINLQGNPENCAGYTPLCAPTPTSLAAGQLRAQPEWDALLLTSSLVGARPLPTTISTAGSVPIAGSSPVENSPAENAPNLVAASFAQPNHSLQTILVNDEPPSASPLTLRLDVGVGSDTVAVQRLTAPAPSATSGVLLAGRETAPTHAGIVTLTLAPGSAALVTVSRSKPTRRRAH